MRFGRVVRWEQDVFAAWRRTADDAPSPNSDVWGELPVNDVCWLAARIEESDISRLYVIGSSDWKERFGTYRIADIATQPTTDTDDKHRHGSRIIDICSACSVGDRFEPIVMVSFSGDGPFVVIDGNHRAVGMHRAGLLVGQEVFLGLHAAIGEKFSWFRRAVGAKKQPDEWSRAPERGS